MRANNRRIPALNGVVHGWIGDWLNYGESRYGEIYARALDETGYKYQVLKNGRYIASVFKLSHQRNTVSFSHHREVATLPEAEPDEILEAFKRDEYRGGDGRSEVPFGTFCQ